MTNYIFKIFRCGLNVSSKFPKIETPMRQLIKMFPERADDVLGECLYVFIGNITLDAYYKSHCKYQLCP